MKHLLLLTTLLGCASASADPTHATESRKVGDFHVIEVAGVIEVAVAIGPTAHVEVSGEQRLLELVTTEVKNGVLVVNTRPSHDRNNDHLHVAITVPALDAVSITGVGAVQVSGLATTRFDARVSGTGDLTLAGRTDTLHVAVTGTGDVRADDLAAATTAIEVTGTGEVRANASRAVEAFVSGMGDIHIHGHPSSIKKTVTGMGEIEIH